MIRHFIDAPGGSAGRGAAGRRVEGAVVAAVLALLTRTAGAQPSPSDDAFLQGKALMEQGRTVEACEKFAESLAIERRGGTLLNLAVCREKEGRYATALRLFHEARERALKDGRDDRATLAEEHVKSVEGRVSWLTVRLADGADAPDLAVQCDGEELPRESWGKLRAVDAGAHTVTAAAAGRPRFEATVEVGEARDTEVVVIPAPPRAEAPAPAAPPLPAHAAVASKPPASPVVPAPARPAWRTPVGWVAVGLGAAALGTGTGFGIRAIVDVRESAPDCRNGFCTTMAAYMQSQDAHPSARIADVMIPLGLAAAGAGLYLLLGGRASARARIGVTAAGAPGVSLGGAF